MAVVQYQTRLKEPRRGLCSSWLASLNPEQGNAYFRGWERLSLKFLVPLCLLPQELRPHQ